MTALAMTRTEQPACEASQRRHFGTAGVHAIAFQRDGRTLLSAGATALRAWQWEPTCRVGSAEAAWGIPAVMQAGDRRLLVAAIQGSQMSLWSLDMDAVRQRDLSCSVHIPQLVLA